MRARRAGNAALVEVIDRRSSANTIVPGIDGCGSRQDGDGLGAAAVITLRAKIDGSRGFDRRTTSPIICQVIQTCNGTMTVSR